jgi:hypothetical protein
MEARSILTVLQMAVGNQTTLLDLDKLASSTGEAHALG